MKVLAIIPARHGSKRVPKKNYRPFGSTTLVNLAINHALESRLIDTIILSSDSEEVLRIGSFYKELILLRRPNELSDDSSPAIEYVTHALRECELDSKPFDMVVILQPSSPLRSAEDIDACIKILSAHPEADSCVSVTKVDHMIHPIKLKKLNGINLEPFYEDESGRFASQDLPDVYVRNCAVYATWRKKLEIHQDVIGKISLAHVMPYYNSVDINSLIDFEFAEYLFLKNANK
jgi:CMP-N-acetylneuraminic acid synthetase